MAFKIRNFYKQMGESPLSQKGSPAKNLSLGNLGANLASMITNKVTMPMVKRMAGVEDQVEEVVEAPVYSGFGADAWDSNFTIENGQRVDKYGNTYTDDAEGFAAFQNAAKAYNTDQKNNEVEVLDTEPVNIEEEVEPIENVVNPNAHTPSEGIQILSGKQRRAARRVQRLRNKAAKRGGLTEGQSKRLNRNIDKAQGDEVAYADRTKLGQVLNKPNEEEIV